MTKTGEVKILASGAAASDNYTIRYEDGKLTVSTRPLRWRRQLQTLHPPRSGGGEQGP